jgi:hypothetical protein
MYDGIFGDIPLGNAMYATALSKPTAHTYQTNTRLSHRLVHAGLLST